MAYNGFLYTRNKIHPNVVYYRRSTFKRTKCPGKLILKKDKLKSRASTPVAKISLALMKNRSDGNIMFRPHWKGDLDGEMHQALIWSTDESLSLLRYNSPTLIDATFRTVPSHFIKCLIVMIYDRGSQLYVLAHTPFRLRKVITIAPIKEIEEAIEFIKSKINPDNYFRRVLEIFCQNMDCRLWGQTMQYL
ncbi:hypothetical protein HZS_5448 [Henneguya salminicola]|nr:hypothetical protein HZS_5448 [Henneguya salminicola]